MLNINSLAMVIKVLVVIANVCILYYVVDMEKQNCQCSESWLRDYIKVVASIMIVMMVVSLVIPTLPQMLFNAVSKNRVLTVPLMVWNVVALGYLVILLVYYNRLTTNNCQCSEDWKRNLLLYPLAFLIPLVLILVVNFGRGFVNAAKK